MIFFFSDEGFFITLFQFFHMHNYNTHNTPSASAIHLMALSLDHINEWKNLGWNYFSQNYQKIFFNCQMEQRRVPETHFFGNQLPGFDLEIIIIFLLSISFFFFSFFFVKILLHHSLKYDKLLHNTISDSS